MVDRVARIDSERCTGCGRCLEVCSSQAIVESLNVLQKTDSNPLSPAKTGCKSGCARAFVMDRRPGSRGRHLQNSPGSARSKGAGTFK